MISFFVDASVSLDSIGFAFSTRVRDSLLSIIFFTCKILIQWNTSKQNSSNYNNRRIKLKLKGLTPAQHRYQALQVA